MLNDKQRQQVRDQFPGVTDDDLDETDTNKLASRIASVSGMPEAAVRDKLTSITGR